MSSKSGITSVKFDHRDIELVEDACVIRGEDKSSFIRRSVKRELARLGLLSEEETKVLRITEQSP